MKWKLKNFGINNTRICVKGECEWKMWQTNSKKKQKNNNHTHCVATKGNEKNCLNESILNWNRPIAMRRMNERDKMKTREKKQKLQ